MNLMMRWSASARGDLGSSNAVAVFLIKAGTGYEFWICSPESCLFSCIQSGISGA
jgi:hypothetical protein